MQPAAPELPPPGTRAGWRGDRGRGAKAARRREPRAPSASRSSPPPPPRAAAAAPGQHPRAGGSLGGAAPAGAHPRRGGAGRGGGPTRPRASLPAARAAAEPGDARQTRFITRGSGAALLPPPRAPLPPRHPGPAALSPSAGFYPRLWLSTPRAGPRGPRGGGGGGRGDLIPAAHARVPGLRPVRKYKIDAEPLPLHTKRPIVRMCLLPRLLGRLERSGEAPAADVLSRRGGWPWTGLMCARVFLNRG
ncbi:unnamed protein product [Rangifer tarandus platyrhynchus]|uniref:Uncharacterized protein n=2 Tax=Rangifer tarandus platyrhynchus TaxID=3082113 RepID=A0ACB0ENW5_RANTA|nr:unnamed protein product [Rangifer tarandus platyrhynchus]CAI9702099.1 unnamed protein product [Rangifer tarandus platyrhynchus]